jgi:hypothetical protein
MGKGVNVSRSLFGMPTVNGPLFFQGEGQLLGPNNEVLNGIDLIELLEGAVELGKRIERQRWKGELNDKLREMSFRSQ